MTGFGPELNRPFVNADNSDSVNLEVWSVTREELIAALDDLVDAAIVQFSRGRVVDVDQQIQALADRLPTSSGPMHIVTASGVARLRGITRQSVSRQQERGRLPTPVALVNETHPAWLVEQIARLGKKGL